MFLPFSRVDFRFVSANHECILEAKLSWRVFVPLAMFVVGLILLSIIGPMSVTALAFGIVVPLTITLAAVGGAIFRLTRWWSDL
jgi:hypothetical protein